MKRYFIFSLFAALSVWACSPYTDLEPGGTAVQDLCGTWTVTRGVSAAEAAGTVDLGLKTKAELDAVDDWADLHNVGTGKYLRTYNTANDDKDSLWFDDGFWQEKFKIGCNYGNLTFSSDTVESITGSGCHAVLRYGQVLKGAATTPRGQKADSIIVYVYYDDGYGFTYKFSGYRYTGFSDDL
ncbi:MAG: hypothetical protein IKM90_09625 [Bacteroidaceae bacterium]|nr:hypothetical protein [Bacteroidaceae bacterium]